MLSQNSTHVRCRRLLFTISVGLLMLSANVRAEPMTIDQTLSDEGQRNTIAFSALSFLSGSLGADSFFPPGKVADFWGFQYLRDNDPSEKGHNTDFLTKAANNMLSVLNDAQEAQLIDLAKKQVEAINQYALKRFPLMKAFRRQLEGDLPTGSTGLDKAAVTAYSAELYRLDGEISFERATVMGGILASLDATQRATLDALKGKGMLDWPDVGDQLDPQKFSHDVHVAVMTYAGDLFSWYLGSIEADVYFAPERQGTYFGSFYMKDAPAMGNPDYTISSTLTGDSGQELLSLLTTEQALLLTGLVDSQRESLQGIVDAREAVATELRKFIAGGTADSATVLSLMEHYGELDGEIVYQYATSFAKVGQSLTDAQKTQIDNMRVEIMGNFSSPPAGAFLYSNAIDMPEISNTDFLFGVATTSPTVSFAVATQAVEENIGSATVEVKLSAATTQEVSVPFTVTGTATKTDDYTTDPVDRVTIAAGQTSATITVKVVDDTVQENDETVIVTLGTPTNATLGDVKEQTLTIKANDSDTTTTPPVTAPTVSFAVATQAVEENIGSATVEVKLSTAAMQEVSVPFTVTGIATQTDDYTHDPVDRVTLAAGQTSATITVKVIDDTLQESDETVIVTLGTPMNATLSDIKEQTLTIKANDVAPVVQPPVVEPPVVEPPVVIAPPLAQLPSVAMAIPGQTLGENAGSAAIIVRLSAAAATDVTVPFSVAGTATVPADYTVSSSPVVIPSGRTEAVITVLIADDTLAEAAETVVITLGTPAGATLGTNAVHTLTLTDNDTPTTAPTTTPTVSTPPVSCFTGTVSGGCQANGATISNVTIAVDGHLAGVTITGTITNNGWLSNATIQEGATVSGGVLTGYIVNAGLIIDFTFRGATLVGGTLGGEIHNIRNGIIEGVTLAADAHVIGGRLKGTIKGDPAAPAVLENVRIMAGSHLSGVTLGKGVIKEAGVILDKGNGDTQPPAEDIPQMPALGDGVATDTKGKALETASHFTGGAVINEGATFASDQAMKKLADLIDIRGAIDVDPADVGKKVDILVYVEYRETADNEPIYLMVGEQGSIQPWNQKVADLVAFEPATLKAKQQVKMYRGLLIGVGQLVIHFGYRLDNGTTVVSANPINIAITEEVNR